MGQPGRLSGGDSLSWILKKDKLATHGKIGISEASSKHRQ
jgi:hypothetical protein